MSEINKEKFKTINELVNEILEFWIANGHFKIKSNYDF